jgi:hypothetical protein
MSLEAESFHKKETLALVGRYATPLAAILAGTGLALAPLDAAPRKIAVFLFVFGLLFNFCFVPLSEHMSDQSRSLLAKSRATVNLWINVILVLLMGRVWHPIWLLLTLSSVGTAIYGTRQRTLITVTFLSFLLVLVNVVQGLTTPMAWGLVLSKAAFIVFMGLMVNDLSHAKKENP